MTNYEDSSLESIATWRQAVASSRSFTIAMVLLMAAGLIAIAMQHRDQESLRRWLRDRVEEHNGPYTVAVDGQPLADPAPVLVALRQGKYVGAHHSSPQKARRISITSPHSNLELIVARDSQTASEYWVFLPSADDPRTDSPKRRYLGRIDAPRFAEAGL